MITASDRKDDFIDRANDLGLIIGHEYDMKDNADGSVTIDTNKFKSPTMVIKNFYTLMGLYSHFASRSWAEDLSWTFIVKSSFTFRFTNRETDSITT